MPPKTPKPKLTPETATVPTTTIDREKTLKDIAVLESHIQTAKNLRENLATYIKEGNTEKQEEITKQIQDVLSQCRAIKRKIEGKSDTTIEVKHIYTNPDTKTVEHHEDITLNLETEIASFTSLYTTHTIEVPPNFRETMEDIWNRNRDKIQEAVEQYGFNTILLIPPTIPNLTELDTKMTGGYTATVGTPISGITETAPTPRIVLLHRSLELDEIPILNKTIKQNAKSQIDDGQSLTLTDYLILQRKLFKETTKHIDNKFWTWLPGSTVPTSGGGSCVVYARWASGGLSVVAVGPGYSTPAIGCRLSRSFF